MGLSSFKFLQWAPEDASLLNHSAYRPFKVIQGRWFWYQWNANMQLPISPSLYMVLSCTVSEIRRHNSWKLPIFPTPLIRRPRCLCCLWNFAVKLTMRKLVILQWRPHDRSVSFCHSASVWQTVRRTDRQTNGFTKSYSTALSLTRCKNNYRTSHCGPVMGRFISRSLCFPGWPVHFRTAYLSVRFQKTITQLLSVPMLLSKQYQPIFADR